MNKAALLRIVNPVMALFLIIQASTGIMRDRIPDGLFYPLHKYCGYILVILVVLHIYLNWGWIKSVISRKK